MRRALLMSVGALAFSTLLAACGNRFLTHFPHRQHLAELSCGGPGQKACLSCASCHQGTSVKTGTWEALSPERCTACHDDAPAVWRRSVRPALATLPAGKAIVFPHDAHLKLTEIRGQCVRCHAGAVVAQGGDPLFPPMETCLGCHQHKVEFQQGSCTGCHREQDLRALRPVSFLSHDGAWMRRHGAEARTQPKQCEACHSQTTCDACHDATRPSNPAQRNPEAITSEQVHRFDFMSRHTIEAQLNPGQCATCHVKTECDACHSTRGVSASVRGGQSPHPAAWGSGASAATNGHGREARRDIGSCATCHDQGAASNCVRCHRVGGIGGTPHPMGWRSSAPVTAPECSACHGGTP